MKLHLIVLAVPGPVKRRDIRVYTAPGVRPRLAGVEMIEAPDPASDGHEIVDAAARAVAALEEAMAK